MRGYQYHFILNLDFGLANSMLAKSKQIPAIKQGKQTPLHIHINWIFPAESFMPHLSDKYLSLLDFQSLPSCREIRSIPLTSCIFNKGAIAVQPQKSLLLVMMYASKRTQSDFFFRPRYMKLSFQCCKLGEPCF